MKIILCFPIKILHIGFLNLEESLYSELSDSAQMRHLLTLNTPQCVRLHHILWKQICELLYLVLSPSNKPSLVCLATFSGGDRCTLPKETGPCFGAFHHYAYNAATGSCEEFLYGGCQGNANNFETEEECLAACSETQGNVHFHLKIICSLFIFCEVKILVPLLIYLCFFVFRLSP